MKRPIGYNSDRDTPENVRRVRLLACKRALHPHKTKLGFTEEAYNAVLSHFEFNFPDTTDEVLLAMVVPSPGDLTWAGLTLPLRDRVVQPINPFMPANPVAPHPQGVTAPPVPPTVTSVSEAQPVPPPTKE
jgi:hypothetical protein